MIEAQSGSNACTHGSAVSRSALASTQSKMAHCKKLVSEVRSSISSSTQQIEEFGALVMPFQVFKLPVWG